MRLGPFLVLTMAAALSSPAWSAELAAADQPQTTAQPDEPPPTPPVDETPLEGRRRPGQPQSELPEAVRQENPDAVAPPPMEAFPRELMSVPDRWRLIEAVGVRSRLWDPYNQNTFKADRPLFKTNDWFISLTGISDTVIEPRSFPIPVSVQTTERSGSLDVFGRSTSLVLSQTGIVGIDRMISMVRWIVMSTQPP